MYVLDWRNPFMKIAALFPACLAVSLAIVSSAWADVRTLLPFYERAVAVDGACAWPQLTRLPGGGIAAFLWPESNHGLTEGAVECWSSPDGGVTWLRTGVPVPYDPGTNRMNLSSGLTAEGDLIAIVSGWDRVRAKVPPGQPPAPTPPGPLRGKTRDPIPAISRDGGRTWIRYPAIPPLEGTGGETLIPYGRILVLPDGKLGSLFYSTAVHLLVSADGGKTWQKRGRLTESFLEPRDRTHNETDWIILENGDFYAVARGYGDGSLTAYRSRDAGATWSAEGHLSGPNQHPASLTRLPDGTLLLSYGIRNPGDHGVCVRAGKPDARAWSDPIKLADFEGWRVAPGQKRSTDSGYPSTVALDDGTLVTAYYSAGVPEHQRYHMGVVRWQLDPALVRWPSGIR